MEQAPVTIIIFNPQGVPPWQPRSPGQVFTDLVNIQSAGAAIQYATRRRELGLGSLCICDVFSAYEELSAWLGESSAMIAAVSLGYRMSTRSPAGAKSLTMSFTGCVIRRNLATFHPGSVDILGCGGVKNGRCLMDFRFAGCRLVVWLLLTVAAGVIKLLFWLILLPLKYYGYWSK